MRHGRTNEANRKANRLSRQIDALTDSLEGLGQEVNRLPVEEKRTTKVRRTELSMPIKVSSKLGRYPAFLKRLVKHAEEQTEQLLAALPWQLRFEEVWEEVLRTLKEEADADGAVEAVADLFAEDAVVAVVPPEGSPAGSLQSNGRERLRDFLRWCLHKNFRIEQTRDYQMEGTSIRFWLLATADRLLAPATDGGAVTLKGRVEWCSRKRR